MIAILAAEGPNGVWIPSDFKEFAWSAAAFGVVLVLLIIKVLPLAKKGLTARSEAIRDELAEAQRARTDAESELSALRSKLGSAEEEKARIISEAQDTAEKVKTDLMARADEDAATAKGRADAELAASSGQASADLMAVAAQQASDAAESVVMANLDDKTYADLIDRYIEQVAQS